jgi:hypothetical protein
MAIYIVLVLIGDVGSYIVGRSVESMAPGYSLPVFLACFFLVFWLAWRLAVRLTEPKPA